MGLCVDLATYYELQRLRMKGHEYATTKEFKKELWKTIRKIEKICKAYLFEASLGELRYYDEKCKNIDVTIMPIGKSFPGSEGASRKEIYLEYAPKFNVKLTTEAMISAFRDGIWRSNYGGYAWSRIAELVLMKVETITDIEKIIYAVHNTGWAYNKDVPWFKTYEHGEHLRDILDRGRDGEKMPYMDIAVRLKLAPFVRGLPAGVKNSPLKVPKYGDWWLNVEIWEDEDGYEEEEETAWAEEPCEEKSCSQPLYEGRYDDEQERER